MIIRSRKVLKTEDQTTETLKTKILKTQKTEELEIERKEG